MKNLLKFSCHALLLGLTLSLTACSEDATLKDAALKLKRKPTIPQAIPVCAPAVGMRPVVSQTAYIGNVQPAKSTVVTAPYSGTLRHLYVRQGEPVKAEKHLAETFSQSVNSQHDAAVATLKRARDMYQRASKVHKSGSIPDAKMVEAETAFKQAEAIERATAEALKDGLLKAPFDGVIDEIMVDEGVELTIGQPILRILDISTIEIRFPVPEKEIGRWQIGDSVYVTVPALDDRGFQAELITTGLSASMVSHTYSCSAKILDATDELKPGMVCKVYDRRQTDSGIIVPASLVERDNHGTYVWVVERNKALKRAVRTAGFSNDGILIVEGLADGDRIITDGRQKITEGSNVEIVAL